MMKAVYWQRGESLDYVNNGDTIIEANTIIDFGTRIAVAGTSINPGEKGSVHVTGVYRMDKKDETEIPFGTAVYFTEGGITAASGGTPAGYAAEQSAAGTETILVKLAG